MKRDMVTGERPVFPRVYPPESTTATARGSTENPVFSPLWMIREVLCPVSLVVRNGQIKMKGNRADYSRP